MRTFLKISTLLLIAIIWVACEGDYRQKARGGFGEAVVIMDSTQWTSETANAIRETYGRSIMTLPTPEPLFNLRFRDFTTNDEQERLKRFKNVIIAAPINDSTNTAKWIRALLSDDVESQVRNGETFAFPLQNHWYKDQWTMVLTAPSDTALARQIDNSEKKLTDNLLNKEFQRWNEEVYEQGEKVELADSIWTNHGWKIRIQHDWLKNIDTTYTENGEESHFLTMRRVLPENNRWFWAWWKDDVKDISYLDNNWINTKRDSLMKTWIRGSRDSSYVTTEYRRPVETEVFEMNGDLTHETLGTWRMTNDAMGGPFVNLTIYDDEADRLYMLEFGQFAPKFEKRRFVRQFRMMLRSFSIDSTWQGPMNKPVEGN
jgi:hypothetical protein